MVGAVEALGVDEWFRQKWMRRGCQGENLCQLLCLETEKMKRQQ